MHDYIEVIGIDAVSQDSCMQMTNQKYLRLLADYVDASQAEALYTLMLGLLTQSTLKGQKPALDYIQAQVKTLLTHLNP
ncbi:hypothetical protein [Vibrio sp. CAU 1672]|uniref:hypothetical protein n=1 Tax=Vibrio sp. CAU 1672 TaxID=3032594 RepID=UPI0023DC7F69|nr:hypothetical protein [Vibrio sp. CAU 1672]